MLNDTFFFSAPQLKRGPLGCDLDPMNLRVLFLPPYTSRRMGTFFILGAIAAVIISTASPTNFRGDWLDPRWWARGFAVLLLICGTVMVVRPSRGGGR